MQRRGAARGSSLLLALALLAMGVAVEGKRHRGAHNSNNHYTVDAPSTAGVVGAAMGHTALMGELEDETSRLQSALGGFIWVWVYGWVGLDQFVDRWIGSFICTYTRKLLKLPTNPHQPPKINSPNPPRPLPAGGLLPQGGALRHPGLRRDHRRAALLRQHHAHVLGPDRGGGGQVEVALHSDGRPRGLHLRNQGWWVGGGLWGVRL